VSTEREQIAAAFERNATRVVLFLVSRYRLSSDEAMDVVHDVFSSLLERAGRGELPRDNPHLLNYILAAARSRAIDLARKEARHRRNESVLLSAIQGTPAPGADAQLILHEQQALLRQAIEELGEPYREIFKMLIYRELSLADIARERNLSLGSIYTQYARGVERLRKILRRGA